MTNDERYLPSFVMPAQPVSFVINDDDGNPTVICHARRSRRHSSSGE
jgi:hypothetical protein